MGNIENYSSLCKEFNILTQKAQKALIETLNKRGVESINVKTYMDKLDALEKKLQENGARIDKAFR